MSYFHEYTNTRGRRTLRSHSVAFDMRNIAPGLWVTSSDPCEEAQDRLASLRQYPMISRQEENPVLNWNPMSSTRPRRRVMASQP
jgi:hypothetical protein